MAASATDLKIPNPLHLPGDIAKDIETDVEDALKDTAGDVGSALLPSFGGIRATMVRVVKVIAGLALIIIGAVQLTHAASGAEKVARAVA